MRLFGGHMSGTSRRAPQAAHRPGRVVRLARVSSLAAILSASSLVGTGAVTAGAAPLAASVHTAQALAFNLTWTHTLADAGNPIAMSSPNVATLDAGGRSVVVGDRAGKVYAFHLSDGSAVPGWPASAPAAVDSTPSAVTLPGNSFDTLFVGAGNSGNPGAGGYEAFNSNGSSKWFVNVGGGFNQAVSASL